MALFSVSLLIQVFIEMDFDLIRETLERLGEEFHQAAREAVRREHYGHDPLNIPDFHEKVERKMWSMISYMIETAGKNAP